MAAITTTTTTTTTTAEDMIIAAPTPAWYAHFDFVKTSTGFWTKKAVDGGGSTGARVEDVNLMARTCAYLLAWALVQEGGIAKKRTCQMKVKASGGIRTLEVAEAMLRVGAVRLGVTAGVAVLREKIGMQGGGDGGRDGGVLRGVVGADGDGDGN